MDFLEIIDMCSVGCMSDIYRLGNCRRGNIVSAGNVL
jgi:hypothetical protein